MRRLVRGGEETRRTEKSREDKRGKEMTDERKKKAKTS